MEDIRKMLGQMVVNMNHFFLSDRTVAVLTVRQKGACLTYECEVPP